MSGISLPGVPPFDRSVLPYRHPSGLFRGIGSGDASREMANPGTKGEVQVARFRFLANIVKQACLPDDGRPDDHRTDRR